MLRLVNSYVNTGVPGTYPEQIVRSSVSGVANVGTIAIIGEADGGLDFSSEAALKNNWFTPDQTSTVLKKYVSGNIVDAFQALASPSADPNITGTASKIYILKTNVGSLASSTIANYGVLSANNQGTDGNLYSYTITEAQSEVGPVIIGTAITNFGSHLTNSTFSVRFDGGAANIINVFTGLPANYGSLTQVLGLLNAAFLADHLPITATQIAIGAGFGIQLAVNVDANANSNGFSKSVELIAGTTTDALALLGLTAGLTVSASEAEIDLSINRTDTYTNESFTIGGNVALQIGYLGTSATITITSTTITTTVTGGTGSNLSIPVSQYATLGQLADFINNQNGYVASVDAIDASKPLSALDEGTFGICSTGAGLLPGRIKRDLYDFITAAGTSVVTTFSATAIAGLPAVKSKTFLSGGSVGGTSNNAIVNALTALEGISVNFVIPLFSQDATADIADGLTDVSSTYTIDAINEVTKAHAIKLSVPKLKKHRQVFCSKWDLFANIRTAAASISSPRVNFCFQQVIAGLSQTYMPWYTSCIAAGMQAGGFYKALVRKLANVISVINPSDFDGDNIGFQEQALESGLLFLETIATGIRWVSDQTTYGFDANFVYNSVQAMYMADVLAVDLAVSLDNAFVGQSLADIDPATAASFIGSKMDGYRKLKMIGSSDDAPAGYILKSIAIVAPTMTVDVEVKLATALYFIPLTIEYSPINKTGKQA
jgi:hypothetical protein